MTRTQQRQDRRPSVTYIDFRCLTPMERLAAEDVADTLYGAGGSLAITAAETLAEEENPSEVHTHFASGRILKVFAMWLAAHQREQLAAMGTGMNQVIEDPIEIEEEAA